MFTDPRKDKQVRSYLWELCSNRGANRTDSAKGSVCYSLLLLLFFVSFYFSCVFIHTDFPVNCQGHNWNVLDSMTFYNTEAILIHLLYSHLMYCTPISDKTMVVNAQKFIEKIKIAHRIHLKMFIITYQPRWSAFTRSHLSTVSVNICEQLHKCSTGTADLCNDTGKQFYFARIW